MSRFLHWGLELTDHCTSTELRNTAMRGNVAWNKLMKYLGHAEFERSSFQEKILSS